VSDARGGSEDIGSLEWLMRTGGDLTFPERVAILAGAVSAFGEGVRLALRARRGDRRNVAISALEPPDTPMVRASREYLESRCVAGMVNHSYRTAFWTAAVLLQNAGLTDENRETAWVAGLLHDVGLEHPPEKGDFSLGGVEALKSLAHEFHWSEKQTHQAGEAIASNLCTRVRSSQVGEVAWAMNVGGAAEVGVVLHRAQLHPRRIAEIEARYPRKGFSETAMRLIREEIRRLIMRD
jgi:HD domain